jgi:NAD(P)-dependent dehydrogenase (short-subunit alcohol dehydrogenase family)
VAVLDNREALAAETAGQIGATTKRSLPVDFDVGDEVSVEQAVSAAVRFLGGLDILVAGAGIVTRGAVHELSLSDWEMVLRTNLTGVFLPAKHCIPHFLKGGAGAIVTIGSISSVVIGPGASAASYKAAKGGVLQLTRAIAVEYAPANIRANCVCPGAVTTDLAAHSRELRTTTAATYQPLRPQLKWPMERSADPSEIAGAVAFLASDDASFITGSALMVDGGLTAI